MVDNCWKNEHHPVRISFSDCKSLLLIYRLFEVQLCSFSASLSACRIVKGRIHWPLGYSGTGHFVVLPPPVSRLILNISLKPSKSHIERIPYPYHHASISRRVNLTSLCFSSQAGDLGFLTSFESPILILGTHPDFEVGKMVLP